MLGCKLDPHDSSASCKGVDLDLTRPIPLARHGQRALTEDRYLTSPLTVDEALGRADTRMTDLM